MGFLCLNYSQIWGLRTFYLKSVTFFLFIPFVFTTVFIRIFAWIRWIGWHFLHINMFLTYRRSIITRNNYCIEALNIHGKYWEFSFLNVVWAQILFEIHPSWTFQLEYFIRLYVECEDISYLIHYSWTFSVVKCQTTLEVMVNKV